MNSDTGKSDVEDIDGFEIENGQKISRLKKLSFGGFFA